jgi:hypothetical protein
MAYVIGAWRTDGDADAVAKAISKIGVIVLCQGVFVVDDDGADWNRVRREFQAVVSGHPGTELVAVAPGKGDRVAGWVHDAPEASELKQLRTIMNRAGSDAVPQFFATPPLP